MRIVMVNKFPHVTGGADRNCLALGAALRERGHEVAWLSTASEERLFDDGAFVRPRVTHASRARLPIGQQVDVARRALWNRDAAAAMRRLIRDFRPDVVHSHKLYPQLSVAPIVEATRAGVPVVQTLHDYELLSASSLNHRGGWIDRDESGAAYRVLNTATFPIRRTVYARSVRAWIACSRFVADRYRRVGITATVLPYFVEPVDRPLPGFADRHGAVFVGRLQEEKGVSDVVALAAQLPALPVRVVGYGPLEPMVRREAARRPNLEFVGQAGRSRVLELLQEARVFLMPSLWEEPGGIAALEAMSVGTAVIAYGNGGLAQYVGDAGGVVVDPDPAALAEACQLLHDREADWQERSRRGIETVRRTHSADAYVPRVEEIYRRAAQT